MERRQFECVFVIVVFRPDIALARQSAADARCQSTGAEHGDHSDPKARKCNSRFRISRVSFFSLVLLVRASLNDF